MSGGSSQWMYQSTGYQIQNSCRFDDGGTPKLVNTPSNASNRKTFTWSSWVKRSSLAGTHVLFGALDASGRDNFYFQDTDKFVIEIMGTVSTTTQVFRDIAAWYHIVVVVDTTQGTNTNRIKLYVNGARVTSFSTGPAYPSQNTDGDINNDVLHVIGKDSWASRAYHFDGYLSEVHFVDGTAYQADSFGEYNKYGQWVPIKPQVTYGTNGFSMLFNTSGNLGLTGAGGATDVGSNYGVTNLAAHDQMTDTPTNNFATFNALDTDIQQNNPVVFTEGNLHAATPVNGNGNCFTTMGVRSGKYYVEILHQADEGSYVPRLLVGVTGDTTGTLQHTTTIGALTTDLDLSYHSQTGTKFIGNSETTNAGAAFAVDDIIGITLNADNGEVTFYKNNAAQFTQALALGGEYHFAIGDTSAGGGATAVLNSGQDCTFGGNVTAANNTDEKGRGEFKYAPPAGFLALCTKSLPEPDVVPSDNFTVLLNAGDSSADEAFTTGFPADWVWSKVRGLDSSWEQVDSVRGVTKVLFADTDGPETTDVESVISFDSNGFTLGTNSGGWNRDSRNYVYYNWRANGSGAANNSGSINSTKTSANVEAGLSIVTYTGNGTAGATVGHGLSKAPEMMWVKNRSKANGESWTVYVSAGGMDGTDQMQLNSTQIKTDTADAWNDTDPTATLFSISGDDRTNDDGETFVAYCFHSVESYCKVGSYFGNGNANGAFVHTGFRPAMVIRKRIDDTTHWHVNDNKRLGFNGPTSNLSLRTSNDDDEDDGDRIDLVSNGFKVRTGSGDANNDNSPFIYIAWAETPFKYSNAR